VWMQDVSGDPDALNPENRASRAIGLLHVRGNHWNSVALADENRNVCGRNLTSWASCTMTLLRMDNETHPGGPQKYLLLKAGDSDHFEWTVPWGNVREQETLEQSAMRRLREEVGMDASTGHVRCQNRSFMSREMYGLKNEGNSVMYVCSLFLAELEHNISTSLDPRWNASWFSYEEIQRLTQEQLVQPIISTAVEHAEKVSFYPPEESYYDDEEDDDDDDCYLDHGCCEDDDEDEDEKEEEASFPPNSYREVVESTFDPHIGTIKRKKKIAGEAAAAVARATSRKNSSSFDPHVGNPNGGSSSSSSNSGRGVQRDPMR